MTPAVGLRNFRFGAPKQFKHLVFVGQKVHTHTHTHVHVDTCTHDVPQTEVVKFAEFILEKT
jgi:hypothetical protein